MRNICFAILLLSLLSCEKEKFPDATNDGNNTFGMRINGVEWTPDVKTFFNGKIKPKAIFFSGNSTLVLEAVGDGECYFSATINGLGRYYLNKSFSPYETDQVWDPVLYRTRYSLLTQHYILHDSLESNITITRFDTINKIVSGIFSLRLEDSIKHEVKEITEGRFDLVYYREENEI